MLNTKIINKDAVNNLVSLNALKAHIKQDDDYEDEDIERKFLSAVDLCEKYTNRFFTPTEIIGYQEKYTKSISLLYCPTEIVSVKAINTDGVEETLDCTFNFVEETIKIDTKYKDYTDFYIDYIAGYKAGELPEALRHGIIMTFATLYEVREDVSYGVQANAVPVNSKTLLDSYRILSSR